MARCGCARRLRSLLSVPVEPARRGRRAGPRLLPEERSFSDATSSWPPPCRRRARCARAQRLYEAERGARALAQQLARTGRPLTSELDPDAVLDDRRTRRRRCSTPTAPRSAARGRRARRHGGGRPRAEARSTRAPGGGLALRRRRAVARAGRARDAGPIRGCASLDPMLAAGYAGYLGVPIAGPEDRPTGCSPSTPRPREWREEETEALLALAASTSAARSNAELYQRVALERERGRDPRQHRRRDRRRRPRRHCRALERAAEASPASRRRTRSAGRRSRCWSGGSSRPRAARGDRLVPIMRGREEVWLSVSEAVMRDPAGAVAGRIFAFRDISGDRLVEQMKSDFVSTVSHELRTPLTSIYGFAETLLRQDVLFGDEERPTFLRYIASESQRLTPIVDPLLNVARLDTGDLQVHLADTDVRDVVGGARHGAAAEQRASLRGRPPRRAARGEGGPREARQVSRPARQRGALLACRRHRDCGAAAARTRSRSASRTRGSASRTPIRSRSSASSTGAMTPSRASARA